MQILLQTFEKTKILQISHLKHWHQSKNKNYMESEKAKWSIYTQLTLQIHHFAFPLSI